MDKLDPTILVALVSLIGLVISGGFGVLVAMVTNRKETKSSAEEAADQAAEQASKAKEDVLRERITLRDERLAQAQLIIVDQEAEIARLKRKCGESP